MLSSPSAVHTPRSSQAVRESRGPRTASRRARIPFLGAVPFLVFVGVFLLIPIGVTVFRAFADTGGGFTLDHVRGVFTPEIMAAFENSISLSLITAAAGGIFGLLLAWALTALEETRVFSVILSLAGVASQMGGAPLAFAFMATIGAQGLVTGWLASLFEVQLNQIIPISSFPALILAYLYFQIPMMTILMLPSVQGLKREWLRGAESLGASAAYRLRTIVLPVLAPALAGSLLLLFANSFSGYAAAYAMAGSGANLVPVLIGYFLGGNVMTNQGLAAALVVGMIVVMVCLMAGRALLLRRVTRWTR